MKKTKPRIDLNTSYQVSIHFIHIYLLTVAVKFTVTFTRLLGKAMVLFVILQLITLKWLQFAEYGCRVILLKEVPERNDYINAIFLDVCRMLFLVFRKTCICTKI